MSQEIATTTAHDAELIPTTSASQQENQLAALQAQAQQMSAAMELAEGLCQTNMVPTAYRGKPADGAAAILYGAELGLNALQSLQQVMVINGKPGVEARTMVSLLRAKGYQFEVGENTNNAVEVTGTAPTGEAYTARWTIEDAKLAGYTKNTLYQKIPNAMLYAKAATEVCRRLGSHVLSGIQYSTEELRLMEKPVKATATRVSQRGTAGLRAALESKAVDQDAPQGDIDVWFDRLSQCKTRDDIKALMETANGALDEPVYQHLSDAANTMWAEMGDE